LFEFSAEESCGKCFPCRLGNTHMLEILDRMCQKKSNPNDLDLIQRIGSSMKSGSLCGHGQLGYNPILSAMKYFREEIEPLVKNGSNILIAAHGNSLRSLIKFLDDVTDEDIVKLEIPTGAPIHYVFDSNGKVMQRNNLF